MMLNVNDKYFISINLISFLKEKCLLDHYQQNSSSNIL